MQDNPSGLNLDNARTPEQQALMQKIINDGVCPFCAEHFRTYHPKPIIKETAHWFFTENISPYKNTTHHFLIVYKPAHITTISELPPEAQNDLFTLVSEMAEKYQMPGAVFFMRFGDPHYNGSSVAHLHAQFLMGHKDAHGEDAVRVKLG